MGIQNKKAVRLYYRLGKKDRDNFAQFLEGNRPTTEACHVKLIVQFLDQNAAPDPKISEEKLLQSCPEIPVASLPRLLSKLYRQLIRYLANEEMNCYPGMVEVFALRQLRKRDLGWDNSIQKSANREIDKIGEDPKALLMKYWLEREHLSFLAQENPRGKRLDLNIMHLQFLLGRYAALERAQHFCEQASLDRVRKRDENPEQRDQEAIDLDALRLKEMHQLARKWPLLAMYLDLYKAIRESVQVPRGIERLAELKSEVSHAQHAELWQMLHNVYTGLLNKGVEGLSEEMFMLLRMGFEEDYVWTPEGTLHSAYLKNLVASASRCGKVEEARKWLEKCRKALPKDRAGVYWLCRMIADFADGKYQDALAAFAQVLRSELFEDLYFRISARFLEAKTHYELKDNTALESDLGRMKSLLYNQKNLAPSHQKIFLKRFRYFERLFNLRQGVNPQYDRLINELENDTVDDKLWILEKAVAAREAQK